MPVDPDAIPRDANEAIAQRLLSDEAVIALVGPEGAYPGIPDTNPNEDDEFMGYVVFYRTDGTAGSILNERRVLQQLGYRLDAYADTDEKCETILLACSNRLFGNARELIAPWRDRARGVQGCFPVDDADVQVLDDASRENGQSFRLHFCPQPQS